MMNNSIDLDTKKRYISSQINKLPKDDKITILGMIIPYVDESHIIKKNTGTSINFCYLDKNIINHIYLEIKRKLDG